MRVQTIKEKNTSFKLDPYEYIMLIFVRGDLFASMGWVNLDSMSRSARGGRHKIIKYDLTWRLGTSQKKEIPKDRFVIMKNLENEKAEMVVNIYE